MVEKAASSTTPESSVCSSGRRSGNCVGAACILNCFQAHQTIQSPVVAYQWDHCNPGTIYCHQYRSKTKWLSEWALCLITFTLSNGGLWGWSPVNYNWTVQVHSYCSYWPFSAFPAVFVLCCATISLKNMTFLNRKCNQQSMHLYW